MKADLAKHGVPKTNSRIILDEGGAERLLGKGDFLANLRHGLVRAQAPMLS